MAMKMKVVVIFVVLVHAINWLSPGSTHAQLASYLTTETSF